MNKQNSIKLLACFAFACLFWVFPAPQGINTEGWRVLGIFSATIAGFLLRPLPMGPLVLLGLVGLSASGTQEYKSVIAGFGNSTVWLVVAAFLIAGAVSRTGFGRRIALLFVVALGRSMLGLAYAICGAELVLGPVVPSNTARGGGIMAPIIESLSVALGSTPQASPNVAGSFLVTVAAHANLITAAMFLTGMAANPLVSQAAYDIFDIEFGWGLWALGAIVPGLLGLALLPLLAQKIMPPTRNDASAARTKAKEELAAMGPWTRDQKTMGAIFILLLLLWSSKAVHGMGSGLVAWIGVCILILTGTESWVNITKNSKAWDTLVWLGGLLAMANALKTTGVVAAFAENMQHQVLGLHATLLAVLLSLIYFFSMYGFSMFTAHISALVGAFLAVAHIGGAPPLLAIALLAYFSNLSGCTTNYSTGPMIIYYGLGYVDTPRWFRNGAIMAVFHLSIWLSVGMAWWKVLGWW